MRNPSSGTSQSIWAATTESDGRFLRLESGLQTDVCIVGAGISGLSVAYHLAKAGRQVVVLDDGPVARAFALLPISPTRSTTAD